MIVSPEYKETVMYKTRFQIGTWASFTYHGKQREGTVEKVTDTYVTLKMPPKGWTSTQTPEENEPPFKSFSFDKITELK